MQTGEILDFVRERIVAHVRGLGLSDLHDTVALYLRERDVLLVPL